MSDDDDDDDDDDDNDNDHAIIIINCQYHDYYYRMDPWIRCPTGYDDDKY